MNKKLLLFAVLSLIAMSCPAQLKRSATAHTPSRPQAQLFKPKVKMEEARMRLPGTPLVKAPKKADSVDVWYRRPAGAFAGIFVEEDGAYIGSYYAPFIYVKPYNEYTFNGFANGFSNDATFWWEVQYMENESDQLTAVNSKDLTWSWGIEYGAVPVFAVNDGDNWYDWFIRGHEMSGTYESPIIEQTYPGSILSVPSIYDVFDYEMLMSSKTFCSGGRNGDEYYLWYYYSGAQPYGNNESGWYFGKNAGTSDGYRIDGIAQAFEKPEHPYLLKQVAVVTAVLEVIAPVEMTCKVYKLEHIPGYDDNASASLPEVPGELIAKGRATLTPETYDATNGLVSFTLYEEEDGLEYEVTPTIDDAILVVIDGYNEPEMANLTDFSAGMSSDYHVDEGFGELAYLKVGYLNGNGNVDHYVWTGLNNFFSIGELKTGLTIFLKIEHPFLVFNYSNEDGVYVFPAEGGLMEKQLPDDITCRSIEFKSSEPSSDDDWDISCNGNEVPAWLSIKLTDQMENGEFAGVVNAEVVADSMPPGVEYREATVRFKILGDFVDYTFIQTPYLYTVAGAPASIFGTEWDPSNKANRMVYANDGIYKLTKKGLELEANDVVQFKIYRDENWQYSWPASNVEIPIEESGVYDITFTFNHNTKEVTYLISLEETTPTPVISYEIGDDYARVYAMGSGDVRLYKDGAEVVNPCIIAREDTVQTFTFTATAKEQDKVISDTATLVVTVPAIDVELEQTEAPKLLYSRDDETGYYTVNITPSLSEPDCAIYYRYNNSNTGEWTEWTRYQDRLFFPEVGHYRVEAYAVTPGKRPSEVTAIDFYISGYIDCGFFFGDLNEPTIGTTNESSLVLNQDDLGKVCEMLLGAYWSARVSGTECIISFPEGLTPVSAETGADMTIETHNARGKVVTETAAASGLVAPWDHFMTLFSTAGYWQNPEGDDPSAWVSYGVNKWEAGLYGEMIKYQIEIDPNFHGGDIVVTTLVASGKDTRGGTVRENGAHAHSFTFKCHVTVSDLPLTGELYILGEVNGHGWDPSHGFKMDTEDENIFTAQITTEGTNIDENDGIGYSFFSFTTKLGENSDDWGSIAPYRIGSNQDGFPLTEDMYGKEIGLAGFGTSNSFKVPAGTYDVSVNLNDMTMVINVPGFQQTSYPYYLGHIDDETGTYYVEILPTEPDCDIYYRYLNFDVPDEWTEWMEYQDILAFRDPGHYRVEAYAVANGKQPSEVIGYEFVVNESVYTDPPTISSEVTADAVIVTARGNGTVILYKDGVQVENPYTVQRTNEEQVITFSATAKEPGKLVSELTTAVITIPRKLIAINERDLAILKEFYNRYQNGHFTWLFGENEFEGEGVTVENERVVAIELSGLELEGSFPTMLLSLDELRTLDLSYNNLRGDAASDITRYVTEHNITATVLQHLYINNNEFTGNVGAMAAVFENLATLNVSVNQFDEVSPMVRPNIDLNMNHQLLQMDADITTGVESLWGAIPPICLYDHKNQTFSSDLTAELVNDGQSPKWTMNLTIYDGMVNMTAPEPYRGDNGQVLAGSTSLLGFWPNEQLLQAKFTFMPGDVNYNGIVDVTDLQSIVNFIFDENKKPFNFTAADMWDDGRVNVQDVVVMVNSLLDRPNPSSNLQIKARGSVSSTDTWVTVRNGDLVIHSAVPVAAFDIIVQTDEAVELNKSLSNVFTVTVKEIDGVTHIIGYSLQRATLPGVENIICSNVTGKVLDAQLADIEAELVHALLNVDSSSIVELSTQPSLNFDGASIRINAARDISKLEWSIYLMDGRLIGQGTLKDCGQTIAIPCKLESSGFYLIEVDVDDVRIIKKIHIAN